MQSQDTLGYLSEGQVWRGTPHFIWPPSSGEFASACFLNFIKTDAYRLGCLVSAFYAQCHGSKILPCCRGLFAIGSFSPLCRISWHAHGNRSPVSGVRFQVAFPPL